MTLVKVPWQPHLLVHRDLLVKLEQVQTRMGRPPMLYGSRSGWRSYAVQKALYEAYLNGTGNIASNPDTGNRAHMRGVAADLADYSPAMQRALVAVGLQRDPAEAWHWQLPNWRAYPIIKALPTPEEKDDDMLVFLKVKGESPVYVVGGGFDYQFATAAELDAFRSVLENSKLVAPPVVEVPSSWTVNLFRRASLPTVAEITAAVPGAGGSSGVGMFTAEDRARLNAVPTAAQNATATTTEISKRLAT